MTVQRSTLRLRPRRADHPAADVRPTSGADEPTMLGFERLIALVAIAAAIALNAARPA